MSQLKHTPGPWTVEDPLGPEILNIVARAGRRVRDWKIVAQISASLEDAEIPFFEAKANANLIAAAPELLLAAVRIHDWLMAKIDADQAAGRPLGLDHIPDGIADLAEAIAKATGGVST
jgi:hypothetical protein